MKNFFQPLLVVVILGVVLGSPNEDHNVVNQKHRSYLMDNLDDIFSPCTQFYPHVCSQWIANHTEHMANYTSITGMINFEAIQELREYLETTTMTNEPDYVKLVQDFYVSCRDNKEFQHLKFMQWMEKEENMKWALLTPMDAKDAVFDWPSTLAIFRKYGFNDLLVEQWNNSKNVFGYVSVYNMQYLNSSITLPPGTMDFVDLWKMIDEFENKFGEIEMPEPREGKIYKLKELPYDWFRKYLMALRRSQQGQDLSNVELAIDNVGCLEALDQLLKEYDDAFICRYLEVRFLIYLEKSQKWAKPTECMSQTRSFLTLATEWIYRELHPGLVAEVPKIHQMFENIIRNVNKTLEMLNKDKIIPQEFLTRLQTMKVQVGNLPAQNIEKSLEENYKNLKLNPHDYYGNYLKMLRFYYNLELAGSNPTNFELFFKTPTYMMPMWEISPKYVMNTNLLLLPYGLLRPPFYHVAYEDIFKQSSLGSLMALRVFDPLYTMGEEVNATAIQLLADLTALHSTFEIFFSSLPSEKMTTSVQELKQMFFVNAVNYRCELSYSYAERVNMMLINLSDFNESFDCKLNKMFKML